MERKRKRRDDKTREAMTLKTQILDWFVYSHKLLGSIPKWWFKTEFAKNSLWNWKRADCTAGNKIRPFDAVVKSRLLYGLQTLEIPDAQCRVLSHSISNVYIHQILRMEPTFVNRANTNHAVRTTANLAIRTRNYPHSYHSAVCRISGTLILGIFCIKTIASP